MVAIKYFNASITVPLFPYLPSKKSHFKGEGSPQLISQAPASNITDNGHRRIKKWLEANYVNKKTKKNYYAVLKTWVRFKYGEESVTHYSGYNFFGKDRKKRKRDIENRLNEIEDGVERYLSELDEGDFLDDFKEFILWMRNKGYAGLTIKSRTSAIKKFLGRQDTRCKIADEDWDQIKRTLIPKSKRAATQDEILTKEQLKFLVQYMSIHVKALAFFLLSTGARIGASCQLKMEDLHLEDDPPWVNIREEYTKGEVGGRVMWFSYEARDAIIEWHKFRKGKKKPGGFGDYDENLVFNFSYRTFACAWNSVLKMADGGQIPPVFARRDPSTKNEVHVYHVHTLRKFFRTNMGMEGSYQGLAGVPDMIVHAWMGHKAYLSEYDRLGNKGMADIYAENMNVVTVYEKTIDEQARAEAKAAMKEAKSLSNQVIVEGAFIDMVGDEANVFDGMSERSIDALSGKEKLQLIMNAVLKMKKTDPTDQDAVYRVLLGEVASLKEIVEKMQNAKA